MSEHQQLNAVAIAAPLLIRIGTLFSTREVRALLLYMALLITAASPQGQNGERTEYNEMIHEEVTYRLKVLINHASFLFLPTGLFLQRIWDGSFCLKQTAVLF